MTARTLCVCLLLAACHEQAAVRTEAEVWHATLDPGGPVLEFGLALEHKGSGWTAFLLNGQERIEVPHVEYSGNELLLDMPHYDSRIRAHRDKYEFVGSWEKRRSATEVARVPFRANYLGDGSAAVQCTTVTVPESLSV